MTAHDVPVARSWAVIGAAKKLESSAIPLLASPQGGVSASSENFAKPPKLTQTGWFSFCSYRKTTPSSRSADASRYFLDRSATPPCGDARRGVTLDCNLFTAPMTAHDLATGTSWAVIDRPYNSDASRLQLPIGLIMISPTRLFCRVRSGHLK